MGWWEVTADTLAGGRFVVSPLAEVTACLKTLERGTATDPDERTWLAAHLPAYRQFQRRDPVSALLVRSALGRTWNATFLTPTPSPALDGSSVGGVDGPTFELELARVRETPAATVRADLTLSLGGPLPTELHRSDLPERAAALLEWVWTESVRPYWPRRRRIIEADVVARTSRLSRGGWAAALADMRPAMRWLGGNRLQISTTAEPPRELAGAQLMFVPVTPRQTWLSWDLPPVRGERPPEAEQADGDGDEGKLGQDRSQDRYAVVYPCSGVLAEAGGAPVPQALGALLGHARAEVLLLLDAPKSTTHLVALTGQALGSVGGHLKVLLDARLVRRRRSGRSVLYFRSDTGEAVVRAQRDGRARATSASMEPRSSRPPHGEGRRLTSRFVDSGREQVPECRHFGADAIRDECPNCPRSMST